jgi:hypothetical protein
MIDDFGANVTRRLQTPGESEAAALPAASFSPLRMMLQVVWVRIRRLLGGGR